MAKISKTEEKHGDSCGKAQREDPAEKSNFSFFEETELGAYGKRRVFL
ncbi:hypothetical protein HUG20_05625 [Salicibibacter cibi]|uniref:Uncharacterized protein n=1 Tax=Salicibibacter cibi TaxID=2743001 RepID=A0A7T6Z9T1_9BACI|nr:hypothetical protein [Salicibibacter cibi]QQK79420.1 hypothetical protein HUG20_05625 [Salicibibacter cibi]